MSISNAMLAAQMYCALAGRGTSRLANGVHRISHPWEKVHLSKAQRKGKTPEELESMRKEIWKTQVRIDADATFDSMKKEANDDQHRSNPDDPRGIDGKSARRTA